MYLHLGSQIVVPYSSIVGIFDLDNSSVSKHTRKFPEIAQKDGRVVNVSYDLPRSFIVCRNQENYFVYISHISSQTLMKRVDENIIT